VQLQPGYLRDVVVHKNSTGSITMLVVPFCQGVSSLSTNCPEALH